MKADDFLVRQFDRAARRRRMRAAEMAEVEATLEGLGPEPPGEAPPSRATLARRLRAGKDVFSAHREHVYQRITPSPAMHRRTSNLYYGAAVASGLAALLVSGGSPILVAAGLLLAALMCLGIAALPKVLGGAGG